MSQLQTIIDWTCQTRQTSPLFDVDADALLMRLQTLKSQESALSQAQQAPASIALYGHSQGAKAHLLTALCGNDQQQLRIKTAGKTLDYFTHINPGHALTQIALRFTPQQTSPDDAFPLRLTLMREAELVQLFLLHALRQGNITPVTRSVVVARLNTWQSLRQTPSIPGIHAEEIGAIARFWQTQVPAREQQIDDALWQQFIDLIPCLDLNARASLWGLLWGEQQALTRQWLAMAQLLQQCGNVREVAAPLSLLVDNFALPVEGFLLPEGDTDGETVIHPLVGDQLQNAVSLPLSALALMTIEITLPTENALLNPAEILDIPALAESEKTELWQSKCRWLLEHYRQQQQLDLLLICNAAATRREIPDTARTLLRWVQDTQPHDDGVLPGLVWVITPQDHRIVHQRHFDEGVQQLIEKPGQHWGTLQALDHSSLQRLIEWVSQAILPERRNARLSRLTQRHQQQLTQTLASWSEHTTPDLNTLRAQAEQLVRELQGRAAILSDLLDGLLPPLRSFEQLDLRQQVREEKVSGLFSEKVDLFARPEEAADALATLSGSNMQAHALWVQHLRQWSRNDANAARFQLPMATLKRVSDALIMISYRLGLPEQLQAVHCDHGSRAALRRTIIGNYLAWLGYADTPLDSRPASRVTKGRPLFAPEEPRITRLTVLSEQPTHAASHYIYDWLVALYTRLTEDPTYRHPWEVSPAARKRLAELL